MKVYSIGRDVACNIVINDNTDVISRRHAILNVAPSGKMTIVDQSHNGTYVNGIRISSNVPVPVTRKDNISFAHVARLDWNMIPNTRAAIIRYSLLGLLAMILIVGGILGFIFWGSSNGSESEGDNPNRPVVTDTTATDTVKKPETPANTENQEQTTPINSEKKCPTCHKTISTCKFKGKHPAPPVEKCKTCGKEIKDCPHKGKHPAKNDSIKRPF